MGFSFDPTVIVLIVAAEALYVRGVRALRRRGYHVPGWQQAAWHTGIALTAIGLLSPIDGLGEELLSAHMGQHLLIADLAVPFLLVGLHSPMHVWFLPRPATVALARSRLRPLFRKLRRPLWAIGIWILILYGWHLSFMFEAALNGTTCCTRVQHEMFVLGSVLIWWPVIEPKKRRAPGELWKVGQILGARLAGMFLGMAFVIMSTPAYEGFYGDSAREHGLSPLTDQQIAGGMMLGLDLLVMLGTVAFFFYRSAEDHDRAAARAAALSALVLLAIGIGACGGGDDDGPGDQEVIRGWITALNAGDHARAASYFAPGAVIEQAQELRLPDRGRAIAFNRSLPCRADLTDVDDEGDTTLAAFRLREGRGGRCGPGEGAGESARVRFTIRDGRIEEWRQLPEAPVPRGRRRLSARLPSRSHPSTRRRAMPGLAGRMSTVIKSKISRLLDRAEDPGETLDYGYQKQVELLQNVKKGIADVVTSKKRLQMQSTKLEQQVVKLDTQARQALSQGREDLARTALERKTLLQTELQSLDTQVSELEAQQEKLIENEKKLRSKVETFRTKKEVIKAQYSAAEAQVKISEAANGVGEEMADLGLALQRAEDKTETMRARAGAVEELEAAGAFDDITQLGSGQDDIDKELAQLGAGAQVDDELAKMKAELGAGGGDAPALEQGEESK